MDALAVALPQPVGAPDARQGPLAAYRARVASGVLAPDQAQARAVEVLQDLWRRLRGYDPQAMGPEDPGFFARLFARRVDADAAMSAPHGLYLVGAVGRGKSMLMDLFFASADVPRKRRIHFHEFMQDAHARVHAWRRANPGGADPIPPLADAIADEAALLCFDEFQIHDIADALILGRLFQALFARGTVVVATSNTPPDDLFRGQPGRDAFLPFIGLIRQHLDLHVLEAARDFRRDRIRGLSTWHTPADAMARRALDASFTALSGEARGMPCRLTVLGRVLEVPEAAHGVARTSFAALCGAALGPADYLALATHFHALVLDEVPRLDAERFDQARRFVTLIDALYEHRCKLIASAVTEPDGLYEAGENAPMFARTASRLLEMGSASYRALPHLT